MFSKSLGSRLPLALSPGLHPSSPPSLWAPWPHVPRPSSSSRPLFLALVPMFPDLLKPCSSISSPLNCSADDDPLPSSSLMMLTTTCQRITPLRRISLWSVTRLLREWRWDNAHPRRPRETLGPFPRRSKLRSWSSKKRCEKKKWINLI